MTQIKSVVETLKKQLKSRQFTYAEIARQLEMSEANVKRMFATQRFSLERLEQICHLMQMELSDLFRLYEESRQQVTQLTQEQERELVSDSRLLLVAVSVRNRLSFDDIIRHYQISETECIRHLARLDRLKIIDLLPNNRIKLRISEDFHWLPNGPIERYFEQQIQAKFLKSGFSRAGQQRLFLSGLLSEASHQVVLTKLQLLGREFAELQRQDAHLPLDKKENLGLLLALKPWEYDLFQPMLRR